MDRPGNGTDSIRDVIGEVREDSSPAGFGMEK